MSETELLSRSGIVRELAQEIRSLETAQRPQGIYVSSGSESMDRCLPNCGYAAGLSLALRIARPWLDDGKYLVIVDSHRRLCAPSLAALKIPLERIIVIRTDNASDWVWGLDQALRSRAVGALITPVKDLEDRSARRLQLAVEQGGGLGILLRDRVSASRYPSWAEVQWQVRSAASKDQATSPRVMMQRWFDLELLRAPGRQSNRRIRLGIDSQGEWIGCDERKYPKSAEHLAAQLAMATPRRRDMAAG
jgi:hypothetical protein